MALKKSCLSEQQIQKISDAVAAAESRTSGELVTIVLERSDAYPGARWRLAIFTAGAAGLAACLGWPLMHPTWMLWIEAAALMVGLALGALAAVLRLFLSPTEIADEVESRALVEFGRRGLAGTRDRTGVLVLVSLLERRVRVLADVGIDSQVPAGTWDGVVTGLVGRVKSGGDLADAISRAIGEIGGILAARFPPREGDTDELPNRPIVE